ncbi:MAG: uroporphyrinogen-III synthase [Planctomycetota bacterium]|nr:uroporphyrinogen-III synthase [Planctomycetota bacterium]MCB9825332.1 uroporphyrinogen-III synthase [Planctomycetota bacterium]MCB9900818.1 uroporphyrinogen-III synthase [Planctomycetota bacterium]
MTAAPRILLTRTAADNARWMQVLRAEGLEGVDFPCLEVHAIEGTDPLVRAHADDADTWAFVSPRAVKLAATLPVAPSPAVRLAAVGTVTAEALRTRFGRVDVVASAGTGASLASDLTVLEPRPRGVLWLGAVDGAIDGVTSLEAAGIPVWTIGLYRTVPASAPQEARADVDALHVDAVFVASPSAWTGLQARAELPDALRLVTIGPTTSAAVRASGRDVFAESDHRDLAGLVAAWRRAVHTEANA